jgi:excisionase family DNA binding protein
MEHKPKKYLMSIKEAALILGVSHYTVRAWINQFKLPHHKLGTRVLLDSEDIDQFIKSCRVKAINEKI